MSTAKTAEAFAKLTRVLAGILLCAACLPYASVHAQTATADITTLSAADGRVVEVHVWKPAGTPRGLIHFSHGAASAPWKYQQLIEPLVAAGYELWAPLHVDSTDHPAREQFQGMASWRARLEDMQLLAATLARPYHAVGHSYGALVAIALAGGMINWPDGLAPLDTAQAPLSIIGFSPPGLIPGLVTAADYARISSPSLIQTGDRDVPLGADPAARWQDHLIAFEVAPADGQRYAIVLTEVDHYFGNAIGRPELEAAPQKMALEIMLDVGVLFLEVYGAEKPELREIAEHALHARLGEKERYTLTRK